MKLGWIGLGRMGKNIVLNLLSKKVEVVAYNRHPDPLKEVIAKGAIGAKSLKDLADKLPSPRLIWVMITAGPAVDQVIFEELVPHLQKGDILIDGGNSHYKDSIRRAARLAQSGIEFVDIGTSGGIEGAAHGACLTIGGKKEIFHQIEWLLKAVSAPEGYLYVGSYGAGHFVKMVHNGIEYALLQSYAEGFEQLHSGPYALDLAAIARVWNHGSVIRSWLLELAERAFQRDPTLEHVAGRVGGGETGRWAAEAAHESHAQSTMLAQALLMRLRSLEQESFASKLVAALRWEFGRHEPPHSRGGSS